MRRGWLIGVVMAVAVAPAAVAVAASGGAAHGRSTRAAHGRSTRAAHGRSAVRQVPTARAHIAATGAPLRPLTRAAVARRALSTAGLRGRLRRELVVLARAGRRPRRPVWLRSLTVAAPHVFASPGLPCLVSGSGGCSLTPCLYFVPTAQATTATAGGPGLRALASGAARRTRPRPRCQAPRRPTGPITA